MLWILGDLSFVGYTAGNRWLYDYLLEDTAHYTYIYDTLTRVDSWDGSGSRCTFSTPTERANFVLSRYPDFTVSDTSFAYYDGTYLVDFAKAEIHPFQGVGIRTLKFPLTVGETWQAIDTCIYAIGERIPHPNGSIDTDTLTDTLWYDTSYASLVSHVGDTVVVALSPIRMAEKITEIYPLDDTLLICCVTTLKELYGTVTYILNSGLYRLNIDSAVFYQSALLIDTAETPWDTTYMPLSYVRTMYNFLTWNLVPISVEERKFRGPLSLTISGRFLKVNTTGDVYAYDGRRIAHLRPGEEIKLKPGIYFVKMGNQTEKVLVR